MLKRAMACLCALFVLLTASALAETPSARERVTAYAMAVHDFEWTLPEKEGVILLYRKDYFARTNGNRLIFDLTLPCVVYGTVRGIPYTLSAYGNGKETVFEEYQALSNAQRAQIANIYNYTGNGYRISMRYGMSCATFVSDCLRQGFAGEKPPLVTGVVTLLSDVRWQRYFTFGKRGWKDYPSLQPGDILAKDGHVMLVMENDVAGERLHIMEQTPPDYAVLHCENQEEVTVAITYRGHPTSMKALRLCMECEACRQATTGTQYRWADYAELGDDEYRAVFIDYERDTQ